MIRKGLFLLILLCAASYTVRAEVDIRVGLFHNRIVEAFTLHCLEGSFTLENSGDALFTIKQGDILYFSRRGSEVVINSGTSELGSYRMLKLTDPTLRSVCRINILQASEAARNYEGDFEFSVDHDALKIINELPFSRYLAGVVETEAGPAGPEEYFKAQAVLCRTYALKHWNKHAGEGFNMCDHTHCQSYKGRSDANPLIPKAVLATHNIVVTDRYSYLIMPAYHSNSGGQTQRARDLWSEEIDYLQAIVDPFSEGTNNYRWQDSLDIDTWRAYLMARGLDVEDIEVDQLLIAQPQRKANFVLEEDTISLSSVREDFDFRSAFFTMNLSGKSIMVEGRGYGHGIGLSQDGAKQMAEEGYSYSDILRFYYHQVLIRDVDRIPVAQLPEEFK